MTASGSVIDQAFEVLPRELFLPKLTRWMGHADAPVRIGHGQTNSQPSLVRQMLEWLSVHPSDKVLDVGSGSGWTSALLAYLVEPGGKVFAVEKIPELVEFGKENAKDTGIRNVNFFQAGDTLGLPTHAPFDRILVSASAKSVPAELIEQLKTGGKMVIPVENDILEVVKETPHELHIQSHSGYMFVPLV
jgi:protein-L-isoaspartate(D-aspartate) O-methyltransferase